ncbi:hypothetical protein SERLA73DRAFT_127316 [Serpula lacrymans var. lacrymans S7.3]|uniref:Uncharacterized protein n=1 Tax=Serpula lacrymans var. lacrymans (strain S7.3) TaxID=936435 RepID=F8QGB1_SERL3|nr:hypothetical protein SERLA73DRAFT_127316 [Serpula lacrymans var. lacrymans S7.3]
MLQELRLIRSGEKSNFDITNSSLPAPSPKFAKSLSTFHGPYQVIPLLVRGNRLRHLSLWNARPTTEVSFIEPAELRAVLHRSRDIVKHVETLEVDVTYINEIVMDVVCSLFPNIKSLFQLNVWLVQLGDFNDGFDRYEDAASPAETTCKITSTRSTLE